MGYLIMRRGEIYFAALNPTIGSEIQKTRPVLIVSNNISNQYSELLTIVPLTSQVTKVYDFEIFLSKKESSLSKTSKVQCHQIRTISKQRLVSQRRSGKLSRQSMQLIDNALKLHLGL